MENRWEVWGIVSIIIIVILLFSLGFTLFLLGRTNLYYEDSFICLDNEEAYCIEKGDQVISKEDFENALICPDDSVHVCMVKEDHERIYGY